MQAVQLEFNLKDENEPDIRIAILQKQIDAMNESLGKVRRRLFSEMDEIRTLCFRLHAENEDLKTLLKENKKTEWLYLQDDCLFIEFDGRL
jgi:hypothetical protein